MVGGEFNEPMRDKAAMVERFEKEYCRVYAHYEYIEASSRSGEFVNDLLHRSRGEISMLIRVVSLITGRAKDFEAKRLHEIFLNSDTIDHDFILAEHFSFEV